MLEEVQSHLESLAEDAGLEISSRKIKQFTNLVIELKSEYDIDLEELVTEFKSIAPSDDDIWEEFINEVADYVLELINEESEDVDDF